jgi:uncharacterized protein (TIGR00661 family)
MILETAKKIHVLVCPLNWGLGHATRCIPIVNSLLSKGVNVTLAASGRNRLLLKEEFPLLEVIDFKGFSPEYPSNGNMLLRMFRLIPSFLWSIVSEHLKLSGLIKSIDIDIVISDNRYGLWNRKVKSIFITHQLFIRAPQGWQGFNKLLRLVNRFFISKFDECWIPDFAGENNLSGELSHLKPVPKNCIFIGPLSRLQHLPKGKTVKEGILIVLSGPEPQREILESILVRQLEQMDTKALLIQGIAEIKQKTIRKGNLTILNYANSGQLSEFLLTYPILICRPGYTTIMDLAIIGGKALFIPTPGQTEQEYLADYFMKKGIAQRVVQNDINLVENIPSAYHYKGFDPIISYQLFQERVELLIHS